MASSRMIWIAPSEKDADNAALEKRLWDAADTATRESASHECEAAWRHFRGAKDHWSANSGLKSQEYSASVLGLIFLRFAEGGGQRAFLERERRYRLQWQHTLGEAEQPGENIPADGR